MSKNIHATQDWVRDNLGIKPTASGELISLSDSAEAPLQSMKIFGKTEQFTTTGKNKLPYPYKSFVDNKSEKYETLGITFINNGDGSIYVKGTSTGYAGLIFTATNILEDGKTYYLPKYSWGRIYCRYNDADGKIKYGNNAFTWSSEYTFVQLYLQTEENITVDEIVYPIIVEGTSYDGIWEPYTGGIPSPNPNYPQELVSVGDGGSTTEYVMGKNFAVYPYRETTKTVNGLTWTDNGDGSISVSGTSEKAYSQFILNNSSNAPKLIHNQTYKLVQSASSKVQILISYTDEKGKLVHSLTGVTWKKEYTFANLYLSVANTNTTVNETIKPLLCLSTETDDTWEPYTEQSLTIQTPNGLPGIPVSSGGNYTDSNGRQYVCGEVDCKKDVQKQLAYQLVLTGNEDIEEGGSMGPAEIDMILHPPIVPPSTESPCLCTHYVTGTMYHVWDGAVRNIICAYDNDIIILTDGFASVEEFKSWLKSQYEAGTPVKIVYILAEPIETPLTEEEIQAYKALHTNYPNTTIYNSDGADAEVEYLADTKNYIDNKIADEVAKLTAAIITE